FQKVRVLVDIAWHGSPPLRVSGGGGFLNTARGRVFREPRVVPLPGAGPSRAPGCGRDARGPTPTPLLPGHPPLASPRRRSPIARAAPLPEDPLHVLGRLPTAARSVTR